MKLIHIHFDQEYTHVYVQKKFPEHFIKND